MDRISLVHHGWDDCYIPTSLDHFLDHLPTWKHLHILRAPELFDGTELLFPCDVFHDISGNSYLPALELGKQINEGTYGRIHKSRRALFRPIRNNTFDRFTPFHTIVTKINSIELTVKERKLPPSEQEKAYVEEIQTHLYEATLHALVYNTLAKAGYPKAAPALYEVFAIGNNQKAKKASEIQAIYMNMEYITGATLQTYFQTKLLPGKQGANDALLIDILIQLCVYLDILQSQLRFNHRDLKVDNVLLRIQDSSWTRKITHKDLTEPWVAKHDLVMLDFGFACVACGETNTSLIQAGCWFKPTHECMKRGRDLALFLYCLEATYPLKHRISAPLYSLLRTATIATRGGKQIPLWDGFEESGIPCSPPEVPQFGEGIYKFLRLSDVDVPGCAPTSLLKRLQSFAKN
jgi:serine/threonine protein kinase